MRRVLLFDTSIFCVWLQLPQFDNCGVGKNLWDFERINSYIQAAEEDGVTFVLPLATVIETGNHIVKCPGDVFPLAKRFCEILHRVNEGKAPWAVFSEQHQLWDAASLTNLVENWPVHAARRISIGDFTISQVADHYVKAGFHVTLFTCDQGLSTLGPSTSARIPRRRQRR